MPRSSRTRSACSAPPAPSLRQNGSRTASIFLTVSRLDGSFGLAGLAATVDPASGALAGLAKTARQEWPEVECKALDLDPAFGSLEASRGANRRGDALARSRGGRAHRGRREPASRSVTARLPGRRPRTCSLSSLGPRDVVVISGGARGITAEVAVALAASFGPRLVLLGRTPAPEQEPGWLAALERRGRDPAGDPGPCRRRVYAPGSQ